MIRSKFFSRFIVVTLTAALLLVSGSRAIRVSALAQPDWTISSEYAPIFDTEIINIEDYMGSHLTGSQLDVFWLLLGVYVCAEGGAEEYKLRNPYATQDGVVNWLKDCGIELWNALVGLNMTPYDPVTGVDWKVLAKKAQDVAMGAAVKASTYDDIDDFLDDVDAKEKYLVPFLPDIQTALHYVFQKDGGLYNWQFESSSFVSNYQFATSVIPPNSNYWSMLETFHEPVVRGDFVGPKNCVMNGDFYDTYRNIFFNTTDHNMYFCDETGHSLNNYNAHIYFRLLGYRNNSGFVEQNDYNGFHTVYYNYPIINNSWQDTVQNVIDNPDIFTGFRCGINDFVEHYYYGPSWDTKVEILNTLDLNFDENQIPYYLQTQNDYLLDIKGIIDDLILPTINLKDVFLNNLFDLEGVIVTDPVLTQVAKDILYEIQSQNIPIPVNLNDIAELTDNSYLERVKEHARNAGDIFANYVAFWHNCDSDLVYTMFGAAILVLVGAFVGKWGHS